MSGNFKRLVVLMVFCFLVQLTCLRAEVGGEEKNPHLWEPKTTSVSVFKNGLGFFLREGEVALRDGWCVACEVPPAAFGTLAIFSEKHGEAVDVVGSGPGEVVAFDGKDAPEDKAYKETRLKAYLNLKLALSYKHNGKDESASGKLISVSSDFAILEGEQNRFAVPTADIKELRLLDLPVRIHVAGEGAKSPSKAKLGMAYLRKGITWIPEYTFELIDETSAQLTLRGTLVNEAEDLIHCDVNFVVGVPHFIHTDYLTPIAAQQVIRTIGTAFVPREIQSQMANTAALLLPQGGGSEVVRSVTVNDNRLREILGELPQIENASASDFTVYTKKDLTLRRGEKAIITLFVKKVGYSHIYRWAMPEDLKHFIVAHNDTDTAWTTGACLTLSGGQPLSEDLLKYTPKGGKCEIPVTTAVNIANSQSESETDRKLNAHSPARDFYLDLVSLRGELTLKNFEKRPAEIIITAFIPGKPISASDGGALSVDTTKLKLEERCGTIRWQITLAPNEEKHFKYEYERYVPSH